MQQKNNVSPLSAYTRFLRKTETKSLAQRKNLWMLLVSREGLGVAEDAGARLNIDEDTLSTWIEEWLRDESHPLIPV